MRLNSGITRTIAHDFYRHLEYNLEKEQIIDIPNGITARKKLKVNQ